VYSLRRGIQATRFAADFVAVATWTDPQTVEEWKPLAGLLFALRLGRPERLSNGHLGGILGKTFPPLELLADSPARPLAREGENPSP